MKRRALLGFAVAAILALTCAGTAFADEPAALTASAAAAQPALETQASKAKVYVISKIDYGYNSEKLSYNKNGLLTKISTGDGYATQYTYSGSKIKNFYTSGGGTRFSSGVNTYKNGKLVKVDNYGSNGGNTYHHTYTYKNGRIAKRSGTIADQPITKKYAYNKKGYVKKMTQTTRSSSSSTKYAYDKKGNLTKKTGPSSYTYKNKYDKRGLLTSKTTIYSGSSSSTIKYSYKRITVPKKYAKAVKAQQRALINGTEVTFVFTDIS